MRTPQACATAARALQQRITGGTGMDGEGCARLIHPASELKLGDQADGVENAVSHLVSLQHEDGHWCGRLEGNSILESEYMLLLWFLGRQTEERFSLAAEAVRDVQNEYGGWPIYPGGPSDVSTSVKAYFALKLAGDS